MKKHCLFLGCGFMASHVAPALLPYLSKATLLDKEKVRPENYDNSVYPKMYPGKSKTLALGVLIQILSDVPVDFVQQKISSFKDLDEIVKKYKPDLGICTFDSVRSRILVKEYCIKEDFPCLMAGAHENYVHVDFADYYPLPKGKEIKKVEESLKKTRDVCSRLQFRPLGVIASSLMTLAFIRYFENKLKTGYIATLEKGFLKLKQIR